jgi:hypothetical protein
MPKLPREDKCEGVVTALDDMYNKTGGLVYSRYLQYSLSHSSYCIDNKPFHGETKSWIVVTRSSTAYVNSKFDEYVRTYVH